MDKFTNLITKAEGPSLSHAERQEMWSAIHAYTHAHEPAPRARVSPSARSFHILRVGAVSALCACLIVASVAEAALPGDLLYPIKTEVSERVALTLSPTAGTDAMLHVALAQRRLKEAEGLLISSAQSGTPANEEDLDQLTVRLEKHVQDAHSWITELQEDDAEEAVRMSTSLEVMITSHQEVLESIEAASSSDSSGALIELHKTLIDAASSTDALQDGAELTLRRSATSTLFDLAEERLTDLEERLSETRDALSDKEVGSASSTDGTDLKLEDVERLIEQARESVSAQENEGLLDTLDSADALIQSILPALDASETIADSGLSQASAEGKPLTEAATSSPSSTAPDVEINNPVI